MARRHRHILTRRAGRHRVRNPRPGVGPGGACRNRRHTLSNSGKTREIVELVDLARNLNPDIPIIVITGDPESLLAKGGNVTLFTGGAPEVCPLGLTPTVSTTMMTVMGDVLVVAVMKTIGFTKAEYAKRHHGGYLGVKSRQ